MTGREDTNLVLRGALRQALANVRPQVYACFNDLLLAPSMAARTHDLHSVLGVLAKGIGEVWGVPIFSVQAVSQCFI